VFGAGNLPSVGKCSLVPLIEEAYGLGIPVVVASPFAANATRDTEYEAGRLALEAGAIAVGNMTYACTMAKLRWALAQAESGSGASADSRLKTVRDILQTVFIGEMD
jgi:L-asparaginase/Glu-tRNA(Gln) amidotransferase subunit D